MRDHLQDTTTYKTLAQGEHECYTSEIHKNILNWLKEHHKMLTKMEHAFIQEENSMNTSPFTRFYLTLKVHILKPGQTVDNLKRWPIVSCPVSLLQ